MKSKSIIPALDCIDLNTALDVVKATASVPEVYGYKLGFSLGLTYGLPLLVEKIKSITSKAIIYDHQKAGSDIPDTGKIFAQTLKNAGIDEAIIFPQAGKATLLAWAEAIREKGMKVIVGGAMTHKGYTLKEGGYLDDEAVYRMYTDAYQAQVLSFVVPLTKPHYAQKLSALLGKGFEECDFYSPGFGAQEGKEQEFSFLPKHKIIIGRSLLAARDKAEYIRKLYSSAVEI